MGEKPENMQIKSIASLQNILERIFRTYFIAEENRLYALRRQLEGLSTDLTGTEAVHDS